MISRTRALYFFLYRSFICLTLKAGRRLHSCFIRPVRIVVRGHVLTVASISYFGQSSEFKDILQNQSSLLFARASLSCPWPTHFDPLRPSKSFARNSSGPCLRESIPSHPLFVFSGRNINSHLFFWEGILTGSVTTFSSISAYQGLGLACGSFSRTIHDPQTASAEDSGRPRPRKEPPWNFVQVSSASGPCVPQQPGCIAHCVL